MVADRGAIFAQIEALERAHGLPPGGSSGGAHGKRGRLTHQMSHQTFQLQIHLRLMAVVEKSFGAVVPVSVVNPCPDVVAGGDVVLADVQPCPSSEYILAPHLGSWPLGLGSPAAASGFSSPGLATQLGINMVVQGVPAPPGGRFCTTSGCLGDSGNTLCGPAAGVGAGGGIAPNGVTVPGDSRECLNTRPVPVQDAGFPWVPLLAPVDKGLPGLGHGLLQADVLSQLISVVIEGLAPIARAALTQQADKDVAAVAPVDSAGTSGS